MLVFVQNIDTPSAWDVLKERLTDMRMSIPTFCIVEGFNYYNLRNRLNSQLVDREFMLDVFSKVGMRVSQEIKPIEYEPRL